VFEGDLDDACPHLAAGTLIGHRARRPGHDLAAQLTEELGAPLLVAAARFLYGRKSVFGVEDWLLHTRRTE
jgi:hypothetical protein